MKRKHLWTEVRKLEFWSRFSYWLVQWFNVGVWAPGECEKWTLEILFTIILLYPLDYYILVCVLWYDMPVHIYVVVGGGLVVKPCSTLVTPWIVACQAPLSVGFSRHEYWSRLPFPSPIYVYLFNYIYVLIYMLVYTYIDGGCSNCLKYALI